MLWEFFCNLADVSDILDVRKSSLDCVADIPIDEVLINPPVGAKSNTLKGDFFSPKKHYNPVMDKFRSTGSSANLELKNINKEILNWLEDIAFENNAHVEKKEWKSKYNSYVVYDYEPFCSEGFEVNVLLSSYDDEHLNFIKYLYDEKLNTIEYLKTCMGQGLTHSH